MTAPKTAPKNLSPISEQLITAVDSEIKSNVVARHKLNSISPSFPYNHRTMANKDSKKLGPTESFMVGGKRFYTKKALLNFLRSDLEG